MRVLITGGAGYLGIELLYALVKSPNIDRVTVLDNLSRAHHNVFLGQRKLLETEKVVLVEGDILNAELVDQLVNNHETIVHLAAQVDSETNLLPHHLYEQTNNWGTANLVDRIRQASSPKRLVNLSTLQIFGSGEVNIDNDSPNPISAYAISKARGERHLGRLTTNQHQHHSYVNLRLPMIFGYSKNFRVESPINRLVFDAQFGKSIRLIASEKLRCPQLGIDDAIDYIKQFVVSEAPLGNANDYPPYISITLESLLEVLGGIYPR